MGCVPAPQQIGALRWRDVVTVEGTVRSLRARPWAENTASVECTIVDGTGGVELVFLGRRLPDVAAVPDLAPNLAPNRVAPPTVAVTAKAEAEVQQDQLSVMAVRKPLARAPVNAPEAPAKMKAPRVSDDWMGVGQ